MANTTNFGWETPDDTDLVKDGAAAMRTLGNSIDASFVDLKGGTTGQILSKNSNTDLDYVWINNDQGDITAVTAGTGLTGGGTSGSVTVSLDSPVSAANGGTAQSSYTTGDIIYASATNTLAKRSIGTTGQVLTVSGGVPTWASGSTFTTYTPTWTNATVGNGTVSAAYATYGDLVTVSVKFTLGSTSSIGSGPRYSLPVTAHSTNYLMYVNGGNLLDSGSYYIECLNFILDSGTTCGIYWNNVNEGATTQNFPVATGASATTPWTWTTNDYIQSFFTYRKA